MNIVTPLVPVAAAALDVIAENVVDLVHAGAGSFSRMLSDNNVSSGAAAPGKAVGTLDPRPGTSPWGEQLRHDTLRQRFETLRRSVHEELVRKLAEQQVDLSEPVVLEIDAMGRLLETGNHRDRAVIEQLLQSDAALAEGVRQLLEQGRALWESSPVRAGEGQGRVVVGRSDLFFQVV